MLFFWTVVCVIPSAWVNAEAQWHLGAGWSWIVAVIGFVILASVFTTASIRSFQRWAVVSGILWGAVAAIFITMNAIIALSGVSGIREAASDKRAFLQRQEGDRTALKSRLEALYTLRKDAATPAMIEAEMRTLTGWKWEKANQRLATAKEIAALQQRLDGWAASTEPVPASTDPGIDNLIVLVVAIFNIKLNERFMAAFLSAAYTLALELGADLGPSAIMFLVHSMRQVNVPHVPERAANVPQNLPNVEFQPIQTCHNVPDVLENFECSADVRPWLAARCDTSSGTFCGTTELANDYNRWASMHNCPTLSVTAMGKALRNLGFKKETSGKKRWVGVKIRSMKLEVVKS